MDCDLRTSWCLHVRFCVLGLALALSLPVRAADPVYAVGGTAVRVGEAVQAATGAHVPVTALLSADEAAMHLALWAAGWREGAPVCDSTSLGGHALPGVA